MTRIGGFVFDVDGTLVHRAGKEVRVIREPARCSSGSGRPESRTRCSRTAATLRRRRSRPSCAARACRSATSRYSRRSDPSRRTSSAFGATPLVLPFLTDAAYDYLEAAGVRLVDGRKEAQIDAVFVAQPSGVDFDELERAARAVIAGARLLTGSYVPAYAGPTARSSAEARC